MFHIEQKWKTLWLIQEPHAVLEVGWADQFQLKKDVIKNSTAEEVRRGFGHFVRLRTLFRLIGLQISRILVNFFPKVVSQLDRSHELVTVSDVLRCLFGCFAGLCLEFENFVPCKRIGLILLSKVDLRIFLRGLFQHGLLLSVISQIAREDLFIGLSPDSDALIGTDRDKIIADGRDSETPNCSKKVVKDEDLVIGIGVYHLHFPVFRSSQDIVRLSDEFYTGDTFLVHK